MKTKGLILIAAAVMLGLALLGLGYSRVNAGGWAVISLESLPEDMQTGHPFTVRFSVLQHGITPMEGLEPLIQVKHATNGTQLTFPAQPTSKTGVYEASLTLPETGQWEWSIAAFSMVQPMPALTVETVPAESLFPGVQKLPSISGISEITLPIVSVVAGLIAAVLFVAALWLRRTSTARLAPVLVVAAILLMVFAGVGATRTYATESRSPVQAQINPTIDNGNALFTSKGCVTCHTHSLVSIPAEFPINSGPNLTRVSLGADYIRLWLKDPQAVKPKTEMPNLNLTEDEIEALVAFLTQTASR